MFVTELQQYMCGVITCIDFVMLNGSCGHHLLRNPRLNILHLNGIRFKRINHVNPCRVPKNSVVIPLLCVVIYIYLVK